MSDFNLNNYLVEHKEKNVGIFPRIPRITCIDGFSLSVQCNSGSYCKPREDYSDSYYEVEVGYPSMKPEFIMKYCDDVENPTGTVYGYVPIELVQQLIESHGGILPNENNLSEIL
jgi:hypothetical protein